MNTIPLATLLPEIEYERNQDILNPSLVLLLEKIKETILKIKLEKLDQAEYYFALLGQIQSILATIVFKDQIIVSDDLRKFIKDFERIDDPWLQEYLFNEIKNNKYSL